MNLKKTLVFDIVHPAHVNLFKNAIKILAVDYTIHITIMDRGIIKKLLAEELPGFQYYVVTKRSKSKLGLILLNNLFRALKMYFLLRRLKPVTGISCGQISFSLPLTLMQVPNYQFSDDIERKYVVLFESYFSTKKYFPPIEKRLLDGLKNTERFNAMKQWAYLHPDYFTPDESVLNFYGLEIKKYYFLREVSTGSFNYYGQTSSTLRNFKPLPGFRVVLSLEDKSQSKLYPEDWIILKEPVRDFYSLIYFSFMVLSSGDSLAREAALLGVPSIYVGVREMAANQVLIDKGILFKSEIEKVYSIIEQFIEKYNTSQQLAIRQDLQDTFDDLTGLIINCAKKGII
jgi:uncharacterized protein